MTPHVRTLADRPDLEPDLEPLLASGWPRFMRESPIDRAYWERLLRDFPDYQVVLTDGEDRLLGAGHSIPFRWHPQSPDLPGGWDEVFSKAIADADAGRVPTAAAALGITMAAAGRGRGLSHLLLSGLREAAASHHLADLVAPVRPSRKAAYPLAPIDRYLAWTTPDGRPFDPWVRVHVDLGGEVLAICAESTIITSAVAQWEDWTQMRFPDSGPYVVPGALVPVEIDRDRDEGRYVGPNVWVRHRIRTPYLGAARDPAPVS